MEFFGLAIVEDTIEVLVSLSKVWFDSEAQLMVVMILR